MRDHCFKYTHTPFNGFTGHLVTTIPTIPAMKQNHAEMREETVLITQKALFKKEHYCTSWRVRMKGEWHAQCQMCTFPGHGCQILFKMHTCHQGDRRRGVGGSAERIRTVQIHDGFKQAGRIFARGARPASEIRARHQRGWCHRTTERYAGTEFHSGTSNATPRWDRGRQRAEDRKQQRPAGAFFS